MTRADYAPTDEPVVHGGLIESVEPDSPAEAAGLLAGETVLTVDGVRLSDVLDWQWHTDSDEIRLTVASRDDERREVSVSRGHGTPWGIEFHDALFDGVRTCRNNCTFCFVTQLPSGMRPALYLRDDDYRLSFLQGNFVTLTNLTDEDVDRIAEQHLSPLYVSVHAVTPGVRAELICAREHDRALERIDELLEAGVDIHVQIVLVPGVNDGEELDRTLTWLAEREGIVSVGIVPLGYTRYQEKYFSSYEDQLAAATVIQQVQRWQFESRERDGVTWVHLADEFYLNARAPFPTAEWYDGYPQYENGIGMVRSFADEVAEARERFAQTVNSLPADCEQVTLVTGMMAATTIAGALNALDAVGRVRLLAVPNLFFGGNVSVTGLLTGRDLADAMCADRQRFAAPTAYVLADAVFNADGLTLDGLTADEIAIQSGCDVRVVSCDAAGLLKGLDDGVCSPPAQDF
jgi:putative radical SAM enzyme (TIGR03279 family)